MNDPISTTLDELIKIKAYARGFSFLPKQPVSSLLSGRHASRLRGRGIAFEELRHYSQGDDVRTIDWKATARLRKTQVRVYSEERERPVLLVVDQRSPMFFGSGRAMKSVAAAELAALGAWRVLASGDRVGAIVFGDDEMTELKPQRSQTRVLRILHEVVRLNQRLPKLDDSQKISVSLNEALEAAIRQAKHDYLVVLISDLDGADQETQRLTTQLAAHNDVIVIAVYDPLGASLQPQHGMLATDRGKTYAIPNSDSFAASFQQAFEQVLTEWSEIFRSLRVPLIPISAASPPVEQLRAFFGSRH